MVAYLSEFIRLLEILGFFWTVFRILIHSEIKVYPQSTYAAFSFSSILMSVVGDVSLYVWHRKLANSGIDKACMRVL